MSLYLPGYSPESCTLYSLLSCFEWAKGFNPVSGTLDSFAAGNDSSLAGSLTGRQTTEDHG